MKQGYHQNTVTSNKAVDKLGDIHVVPALHIERQVEYSIGLPLGTMGDPDCNRPYKLTIFYDGTGPGTARSWDQTASLQPGTCLTTDTFPRPFPFQAPFLNSGSGDTWHHYPCLSTSTSSVLRGFLRLLLLVAGNEELNPRPAVQFPCSVCGQIKVAGGWLAFQCMVCDQ